MVTRNAYEKAMKYEFLQDLRMMEKLREEKQFERLMLLESCALLCEAMEAVNF